MQAEQLNPVVRDLRIRDFSGGKTDYYIDGEINTAQHVDNVLVQKNRTLIQRPGSLIYDADNPQVPTGNDRVDNLIYFGDQLFARTGRKLHYISGGSFNTLEGPVDSNQAFGKNTLTNGHIAYDEWRDHLFVTVSDYQRPRKIYYDGSDWQVRTAGLPALDSSPTCTAGAGNNHSFIYYFCYKYTYTVGSVTFIDRGPLTQVSVESNAIDGANPMAITSIPTLSNGSDEECWHETDIDIEIYRTEENGTVGKLVTTIDNGTTTYDDSTEDADLGINVYTNGGVKENDLPPKSKFLTIAEDTGFYGNVKDEDGTLRPYRIRQSIPGDLDSCPETFYVDVSGDLEGISNIGSVPMAFTINKSFRIEGEKFNTRGEGFLRAEQVSDTVGCVSQNSIIRTTKGLLFAALDGFYYTDGYRFIKLSDGLNDTYATLVANETQRKRIQGSYDKANNRFYWTVESSDSDENDALFVLDATWGLKNKSCFTTWNDQAQSESFRPTSIAFVNGNLIRGDSRGYIFQHDSDNLTDPEVDTSTSVANWDTETILYDYTSPAFAFGGEFNRKWIGEIKAFFDNSSNLSVQLSTSNDLDENFIELKPIRYTGAFTWGDPLFVWGDESFVWNEQKIVSSNRRMKAGKLRCTYKQIKISNANVIIATWEDLSTATVDAGARTITLDTPATNEWPLSCEDYKILFQDDGYTNEFTITNRSSDSEIAVKDDDNKLVNGSDGWKIKGKPKNELFSMVSYIIPYVIMGDNHAGYQASEAGEPSS